MASLGIQFDPNSVAPSTGGSGGLHPAGDFEFEFTESEVKPTSKGNGQIMTFVLVNVGNPEDSSAGAANGQKVYASINVVNESAQAQKIGQEQLSALCASAEFVEQLTDSEQLHYKRLWARVVHKPQMSKESGYKSPAFHDDGTPKMRAEVQRYLFGDDEAAPAAPATKAAPQAAPPAAAAAPAGGARKWAKRA